MNFLDCTFRDGGYYNNWDFDPGRAKKVIESLNQSGVNIIEIGYKTPIPQKEFFGLFRYCNEDFLHFLSKDDSADYAFMIDIKQFIKGNKINTEALDEQIKHSEQSFFKWCRLASHFNTIEYVPAFTRYFKEKCYSVTFNLMGGSLLSSEQIKQGLIKAEESKVDVFYLADSFGSFYPEDVRQLMLFFKDHYGGKIGCHMHENQGMAYPNSMVALEEGADFIDGTLSGMGRGAGNLQTEQFLMGYTHKYQDGRFNANALFPVLENYIAPMKRKFKWGFNATYMFSGLKNIHPTYCQELIESGRYTLEEVSNILESIPHENRASYKFLALDKAVKEQLRTELKEELASDNVPRFDIEKINKDTVIVVARGENVRGHIGNIKMLVDDQGFSLIECNETGLFNEEDERILAILNQIKLQSWLKKAEAYNKTTLISGFPVQMNGINGGFYPFKIGNFELRSNEVVIPDYDAGLYAIALAIKAGVKRILLAGFDGFEEIELNKSKELLFKQLAEDVQVKDVEIFHITPTNYRVFPERSLYEL